MAGDSEEGGRVETRPVETKRASWLWVALAVVVVVALLGGIIWLRGRAKSPDSVPAATPMATSPATVVVLPVSTEEPEVVTEVEPEIQATAEVTVTPESSEAEMAQMQAQLDLLSQQVMSLTLFLQLEEPEIAGQPEEQSKEQPDEAEAEVAEEEQQAEADYGQIQRTGVVDTRSVNGWEVVIFEGATKQMTGDWLEQIEEIQPGAWSEFPNVDNDRVDFSAGNGLEYAEDETGYCEQGETCDLVVPPLHYRIVSGDYDVGFDACSAENDEAGCAFMAVNVGNVSTGLEDISVDFGFTVWGRYWNGDELGQAIWAGLSHVASNMLNRPSPLNPSGLANAGGNCSSPSGCEKVRLAYYVFSGNELLMAGVTMAP